MQNLQFVADQGGLISGLFGWPFPLNELQIENKNAVENGDEQQGDEGRHAKPANLRITKGFPQRSAVQCERKESEHGSANGNQHRPEADYPGIDQCTSQGLCVSV